MCIRDRLRAGSDKNCLRIFFDSLPGFGAGKSGKFPSYSLPDVVLGRVSSKWNSSVVEASEYGLRGPPFRFQGALWGVVTFKVFHDGLLPSSVDWLL